MAKYIVEVIVPLEDGNKDSGFLECESIEEFIKTRDEYENEFEVELKLYECKELNV